LIGESSPYLLQHAHNPVDWYPWGAEALDRARLEDKPILLSIGYSACHWCHVMEHESFENDAIAAQMNANFINVKVDREERPDLDGIYMQAVQALTGQGGWPMTVFLTPDSEPFWGGTYFRPHDFVRILGALADAWRTRRDEVLAAGRDLGQRLQLDQTPPPSGPFTSSVLDSAARGLLAQVDPVHGGFGSAPKFPQPMAIELLLREWRRSGDEHSLRAALEALRAMARGGVYDHLGGGFHRYSVDAEWLVPHFEKMLYDNAQLARAYLAGYQVSGDRALRRTAEETLDYVLRDMTDPAGGFYSTEDADSEGVEGKFYVWTPAEVRTLLAEHEARLFCAVYGVSDAGNFEHGTSILYLPLSLGDAARRLDIAEEQLAAILERARAALFEARTRRVRPHRDDKIVTAWNGLMLRALAEAARVFGRSDLLLAARRNAEFLLSTMRAADARLFRTWKPGRAAKLNGYLEDYATTADGLVAVYEATFERRWLDAAIELADAMITRFADERGGFFDTAIDHEMLITRPKDVYDNATPSGNAVAADVLLRLAVLTGRAEYRQRAEATLAPLHAAMARYPLGFARSLAAVDFLLGAPKEIAIIGQPDGADTQALAQAVFAPFLPNKVVAGAAPGDAAATTGIPLLEYRDALDGKATAYVCQNYTCQAPVTTPEALSPQLRTQD
jgi:uncharacterized protein YyaL (SSP411 family)